MSGAWRRLLDWLDRRIGFRENILPVLRHKVPPGARWKYVFGSAVLAAFLLQVVTGIALATIYVPAAGDAYQSLQYISHQALLGRVLRGLHYFGASAMILLIGVHAIRVFLTGSFKFPRELNWISGVVLLGLTIVMGFSGQVLRWDQDGVWSTVVAAEQAGRVPFFGHALARFILAGERIGAATLSHLFAYHVFVVPGLIILLIGLHLYLVIRHGISEPAEPGRPVDPATYQADYQQLLNERGVPYWPDAAWRDVVFALVVVLIVLGLAIVIGPKPLGKPPNPSLVDAQPRPDWYLLWYFAILAVLPHGSEEYLIWILPLTGGLVLLLLPILFNRGERHVRRRPWALVSVLVIVAGVGVFWRLGVRAPWSPHFDAPLLPDSVVASSDVAVQRGAVLFHSRGCENCHRIAGLGGIRGPDLTHVGDRLPGPQIAQWIENGGHNMPAFGKVLSAGQVDTLRAFLVTRRREPTGQGP